MTAVYRLYHLFGGHEFQAYGRGDVEDLAGGGQSSVVGVDPKNYDVVGVLIRHEQELAGGVDFEVTWRLALGGKVIYER